MNFDPLEFIIETRNFEFSFKVLKFIVSDNWIAQQLIHFFVINLRVIWFLYSVTRRLFDIEPK
jgi:hypothetical protein